jgi:hypothetical protein
MAETHTCVHNNSIHVNGRVRECDWGAQVTRKHRWVVLRLLMTMFVGIHIDCGWDKHTHKLAGSLGCGAAI